MKQNVLNLFAYKLNKLALTLPRATRKFTSRVAMLDRLQMNHCVKKFIFSMKISSHLYCNN